MELGAFSVSLAVKDLDASKAFYEKLGFSVFAGEADQNWLIMKNGTCVIGLFQGMFEQEHPDLQPRLGSGCRPPRLFHRCARLAALAQIAGRENRAGG